MLRESVGLPPDGAWSPCVTGRTQAELGVFSQDLHSSGRKDTTVLLVFEGMLPGQERARLWDISRGQKVEVLGVRKCHFTISAV